MAGTLKINKSTFLTLAAALAGMATVQACVSEDNSDDTNAGGSAGMSSGGSGGSSAGSGGSKASGGTSAGGSSGAGAAAGDAGAPASGGAAGEGGTGGASGGEGGGPAGEGGAPGCDDSAGSPNCEGVTEGCLPYCNAAVSNLKPAVAVAAIACLELDSTAYCDTGYSCLADATAEGCPEDVATICAGAEDTCTSSGSGEPACEMLMSGMNEAARDTMADCIAETCYSVYSCAEGLFFE
jgi:hypothetical protein